MKQPKQQEPSSFELVLIAFLAFLLIIALCALAPGCKTIRQSQKNKQRIDSVSQVKKDSTGFHSLDTASVKKEVKEWENVLEVEYDNGVIITPIDPKDFTSILPSIKGPVKKVTIKSKGKEVSKDSSHKKEVQAASVKTDSKTDVSKKTKTVDKEKKSPSLVPYIAGLLVLVLLVAFLWIRRKKKQVIDPLNLRNE